MLDIAELLKLIPALFVTFDLSANIPVVPVLFNPICPLFVTVKLFTD